MKALCPTLRIRCRPRRRTAHSGRHLAPFARLLLAVAYLRERDGPRARHMLEQLRDEFPQNPLYSREIARIDAGRN